MYFGQKSNEGKKSPYRPLQTFGPLHNPICKGPHTLITALFQCGNEGVILYGLGSCEVKR